MFKRSIQSRLERFALDAQECFLLTNALPKMDAHLALLTEEATSLRNELKLLEGLQKLAE